MAARNKRFRKEHLPNPDLKLGSFKDTFCSWRLCIWKWEDPRQVTEDLDEAQRIDRSLLYRIDFERFIYGNEHFQSA